MHLKIGWKCLFSTLCAATVYDDMLHKQYEVTTFFPGLVEEKNGSWSKKKKTTTRENFFLAWQGRVKCVNWHECQRGVISNIIDLSLLAS